MEVAALIDILTCILFMIRLKLLFYRNIVAPEKEKHKFMYFPKANCKPYESLLNTLLFLQSPCPSSREEVVFIMD